MFKRRSSIAGSDAKFFPQDEDPRESILFESENSSNTFYDIRENKSLEEQKDVSDKGGGSGGGGHRSIEEAGDSVSHKPGKEGRKEDSSRRASSASASNHNHNHSQEGAKNEREQQSDAAELVKLLERSRSSMQTKTLLLKILSNESKFEELKQLLRDDAGGSGSGNGSGSKKTGEKADTGLDAGSNHEKQQQHRKTTRRPSRIESSSGTSSSATQRDPTKSSSGTRRTTRSRNTERGSRSSNNGSFNKTTTTTTTNDDPASPGSGMPSRIRSPELTLRKKSLNTSPDLSSSNNHTSNLRGSSSSIQLRPHNRRSDMKKLQSLANLGPDHAPPPPSSSSSGNRNQSFNKRTISAGTFSSRQEQKGLDGSQNSSWDVPRRDSVNRRDTVDRLRFKSLRNLNVEKDDDEDDDSNDDAMETEDTFPPSNNASFGQFGSGRGRGQREQTHGLHSLLDDLRLGKDSNSSSKDVDEEEDTTTKKKKNIRKFLSRQLSIKNFTGKEKSGSMDFTKMNDNGLADVKEPSDDSISSLFGE